MQPNHLQALIDIQANNISNMHGQISVLKMVARDCAINYAAYGGEADYNEKAYCYKAISKLTRRIAKLVVLQRVLKQEMHGEILDERFARMLSGFIRTNRENV